MYEPYGEPKRPRINFNEIKFKIQEMLRKIRRNRWSLIASILIVLAILGMGGYTGYTTYTAKVNEAKSKTVILEKQIDACQVELTSIKNDLSTCNTNLNEKQEKISNLEKEIQEQVNLEKTKTETCQLEKERLRKDITQTQKHLADLQLKHSNLESDYKTLQNDLSDTRDRLKKIECNYAWSICRSVGFKYYYVKSDMTIGCCLDSNSIDSCSPPKPANTNEIKEVC